MILLATERGLVVCKRRGDGFWEVIHRTLENLSLTSVIAREEVILVGTTEGVYRSNDYGRTWLEASAGLTARHIRWMSYHPDISDFELCGTEPAGIFVSRDGGENWRECPEVTQLRHRFGW